MLLPPLPPLLPPPPPPPGSRPGEDEDDDEDDPTAVADTALTPAVSVSIKAKPPPVPPVLLPKPISSGRLRGDAIALKSRVMLPMAASTDVTAAVLSTIAVVFPPTAALVALVLLVRPSMWGHQHEHNATDSHTLSQPATRTTQAGVQPHTRHTGLYSPARFRHH